MEHAAGNAVQPAAHRRQPDAEEAGLHPRTEAGELPAERGGGRSGQLGTEHSMSERTRPRRVAENLLYSGRTRRLGADVHADFPRGRLDVRLLFGPAVQRLGRIRPRCRIWAAAAAPLTWHIARRRRKRPSPIAFPRRCCRRRCPRRSNGARRKTPAPPRPPPRQSRARNRAAPSPAGGIDWRLGHTLQHENSSPGLAEVDGNRTHLGLC